MEEADTRNLGASLPIQVELGGDFEFQSATTKCLQLSPKCAVIIWCMFIVWIMGRVCAIFGVNSQDEERKTICINIIFQRGVNNVTIPIEIGATYNSVNVTNSDSEIIKVNGLVVTTPFSVVNGDSLYIKVNKSDANISSEIEISGTIS